MHEYSCTKSESVAQIRTTVAELQHFFLGDCFLLAHPVYLERPYDSSGQYDDKFTFSANWSIILHAACDEDWHLLHFTLTLSFTSLIPNFFGRSLSQVTVCTTFFLLKPPPTVLTSFVRGNTHTCFPLFNVRSLKTLILIVVYLNMCNSLTITYVFFLASHCRSHALCFISRILYFVYFCLFCLTV